MKGRIGKVVGLSNDKSTAVVVRFATEEDDWTFLIKELKLL
jgi:hypothetical protein